MSEFELNDDSYFENDQVKFYLNDNKLYGEYKTSSIDLQLAQEATGIRRRLTKEQDVLAIADLFMVKHVTKEAREYFSSVEAGRNIIALAIIIKHPVTKSIVNFFLKFQKPAYAIKAFNTVEKAEVWLEDHLIAS